MSDSASEEPEVLLALREAGARHADGAPPLTTEQVDRVVGILRLGVADGGQPRRGEGAR